MSASDWRERPRKRAVASSVSSGRAGININDKIYTAQIRALYQHTPMVLAVNVANSALVAVVLGSYLEQARWWIFFVLVIALTGCVRSGGSVTAMIGNLTKPRPSGRYSQR